MYVKITNGSVDTYPYSIGQLRRDNPQTSFPKQIPAEILADYGVYAVTVDASPSVDIRTKNITQNTTPTGSGSSWTLGWTTSDKTADEIADYDTKLAANNRKLRDDKLAETDFYALTDVTMDAAMTTYRQALRDITTHANWPNLADSDWPTKP